MKEDLPLPHNTLWGLLRCNSPSMLQNIQFCHDENTCLTETKEWKCFFDKQNKPNKPSETSKTSSTMRRVSQLRICWQTNCLNLLNRNLYSQFFHWCFIHVVVRIRQKYTKHPQSEVLKFCFVLLKPILLAWTVSWWRRVKKKTFV